MPIGHGLISLIRESTDERPMLSRESRIAINTSILQRLDARGLADGSTVTV